MHIKPYIPLVLLFQYVDWVSKKCIQDCIGAAPCGGIKKFWDIGHATAESCCNMLPWVPQAYCLGPWESTVLVERVIMCQPIIQGILPTVDAQIVCVGLFDNRETEVTKWWLKYPCPDFVPPEESAFSLQKSRAFKDTSQLNQAKADEN